MGKTLNRDQRKNNKYSQRNEDRALKQMGFEYVNEQSRKPKPKKKWKPHSEIEFD